uniref:Uncharacterized protein n=1 Tax=Sphaerodactylus townsendi TaxID=933632 RepID=A0ACB8G596_9SAUR
MGERIVLELAGRGGGSKEFFFFLSQFLDPAVIRKAKLDHREPRYIVPVETPRTVGDSLTGVSKCEGLWLR